MIQLLQYKINKFLLVLFTLASTSIFSQNCTVNANVNQTICVNETLTLVGNANGLAEPGSNFIGWSQLSGPSVSITTPDQLTTTVTGFTAGNTNVFSFSAKCSALSTIKDDVTVV